jgi:isopentenyl-diphosphate Delta-isomerase
MNTQQFEARKREHIQHSLNEVHQAMGFSGLDRIHLTHEAIPDLNFLDIRLDTPCLGRILPTPFYVAGMTAGHTDAFSINETLAKACQERGWAMGVGSQRRDLEEGVGGALKEWRALREKVSDLVLFANIGMTQLIHADFLKIQRIIRELRAQALVVHTNPLQEVLQPEGTPSFKGAWDTLKRYCHELDSPVVLKETGCGFSQSTLERLACLGLAAIDLSGLGGTHWGRIEGARGKPDSIRARAAVIFANWGESTVQSVLAAAQVKWASTEIWASGGVRSGLDAAKLVALGAHRVGYAKPALEAALAGPEKLRMWMETQEFELKTALFCTGSSQCEELRRKERIWRIDAI